jgi:CubicO group peptidase (beta-lactamase class C family)
VVAPSAAATISLPVGDYYPLMSASTFRHLILPLSVAASVAVAQDAAAPPSAAPPSDGQLVSRVNEYMARLEGLGYAGGVLVIRDGKLVFQRSYGFANRAAGIRADTSTVFSLGSITKQFTAAAALRLEELGKLHTTDSIARFFPSAPPDKRNITVHQLLTHTAGFNSDYSPTDYEETSRSEYVRRMFAAPLRSAPGTKFFYANSGYSLLAAIVELVTGRDYDTALRELVLQPAGMRETGYKAPAWTPSRIAHGYQNGRDWGTIAERIAPAAAPYWALRGNGGLHTTLGDMARWDAALNDSRMLTDSSRRKFMTGYVNEGPEGLSQYAYGWAVMKTSRGTRLVTHNGGNGVFVAELLRFVDDHVTIFVTSTVSEFTATQAVRVISRIVFGQPYELPPLRAMAAPATLAAAAGSYRLADGSRLVLRADDGRLMAEAVGQQAYALLLTGDTASPPNAPALNERSRAIVDALVAGNAAPLRTALGPGGPDSAEVAQQEAQLMAGRRERFGAFRSIDVLGTIRGPEGGLQTTVRLNFERGGATNIYTWDRTGHIMDLGARPWQAVELVPSAAGEFRSFDGRGGIGVRLVFDAGSAIAITPHGRVALARQ